MLKDNTFKRTKNFGDYLEKRLDKGKIAEIEKEAKLNIRSYKKSIKSLQKALVPKLQDDTFAINYLNLALQDEDSALVLLALRNIAKARKVPFSHLEKQTKILASRISRILSEDGNPTFLDFRSIVNALGFELELQARQE